MVVEAASSTTGFWTFEFWGNITNLIGVVILGMAVPLGKWLIKKKEQMASENRKREDERIAKICSEMVKPVMDKLDTITGDVNYLKGYVKKNLDNDDEDGGPSDIGGRYPRNSGGSGGPSSRNRTRPFRRFDSYGNEEMNPDYNTDLR